MEIGDAVVKPEGYPFPGWVVSVFENRAGQTRYVVESKLAPGMLHIFSEKQIRLRDVDDIAADYFKENISSIYTSGGAPEWVVHDAMTRYVRDVKASPEAIEQLQRWEREHA